MSWRHRIHQALDPALDIEIEDERYLGDTVQHRAAAVLIPITDRAEPGVILTQRPTWLRSHAGQVAFPGGKVDDSDESSIFAALREAEEELNIPPARVEVIGVADTYYSGSGYSIAPVVGIIPPDLELKPNPQEVEDWFEVPLAFLLDPANSIKKEANWNGQQRSYYDMQWGERRIWGVTAGIIANLVRRLA
ncbi:MAG: CoA pyrophosphatase [Sphingomonadales bacterium 35-56-22]|jgi:8-oxo-dGTP pyrophosphatase MutT (NUDIX family)|uniref:CoA pyrophosphatase n=1 Tax=Sphingorhabdus sp. TaxID=1902408 RepID=UPI000BD72CB9|nr:CoA pyrophosphatase [Sphingorhabdus sp.]OYY16463.1 MAG: CoA pyrophosphatase [Sphingomonadales bacterium 35-56-22]OYY98230.1 MAG: CoA pyrophosphatase [Sphingomonadales bacterium 28-56-43]OYZ60701.1 MAG: CoA pyrophosphatase [Sphingomonadales bacterium 24-56-14]OZA83750.1 MAG: CoA pyrophosphatase [Sphingomonadales bacterium 39-57-19]HQS11876.1 CoA pyrophosphatase [Sphingorhabdus sp.]